MASLGLGMLFLVPLFVLTDLGLCLCVGCYARFMLVSVPVLVLY